MAASFDFSKTTGFEWDKANIEHIKKHDINYRECEEAILSEPLITNNDETHSQIEERFRAYGKTNNKRLILIIFTIRNNKIRVVSARDQSRKERKEFQETGGEQS
ncbi:BrnT family toxin [Candidatus Microgenomates bacterium]|nr:BrnT family toxin [Candidatus Microgenomates bacterium]